ncbi:MAG: hypothetical protein GF400_10405 [Candidatus Eisenbacteria bacterium]|nr:hypothetical protein [Candidatus Eisenbacteria bacterium]
MWPILSAITRGFEFVMIPFARLHPWVGLIVVSVATGVVMLLIFGKTSNQQKIAETKDKLKAYIMEMWIFRNDTRIMFGSIGRVILSNLQYLRHSLRPIVFIIVPVIIIMVQLGIRYENEPFMPGDETVVTVKLREGAVPTRTTIELVGAPGAGPESPPLRVDSEGEVRWKLVARLPGSYELSFVLGDEDVITKTMQVGPGHGVDVLSEVRARAGTWDAFLNPGEPPIPRDSTIESIALDYPAGELSLFGLGVHWLISFFIISVAAGFALKGVFGIEV